MKKMMGVLDNAVSAYGAPFFVAHVGEALRSFTDAVNGPPESSVIALHPEDFTLFELGDFDEVTGEFKLLERPRMVVRGAEVKK